MPFGSIIARILYILLAIAVVVGLYKGTIWVLALLDVNFPSDILTVIFVIIGLLLAIAVLTGRVDGWFRWGSPPA